MQFRKTLTEFVLSFFIITACITMLEGTLGMIFMPDLRFGFDAFFSPPLFGLLSSLSGLVTKSSRELSKKQLLFREFLQLLLIEGMVFGVNYAVGNVYDLTLSLALAAAIAVVFCLVYFIMWLNDRQSAKLFNEQLKRFQKEVSDAGLSPSGE